MTNELYEKLNVYSDAFQHIREFLNEKERRLFLAKTAIQFGYGAGMVLSKRTGVSYYEQKTFWALGDYRLRSQSGIERLVNLLTLCYSSVKLLPYLSQDFSALKDLSAQQARFKLGELIRREVFFAAFVDHLETTKNSSALVNLLKSRIFPFLSAA